MHARTNHFMTSSPGLGPALMLHLEKQLNPQKAADGLCVGYAAIAHHFDRLVERHGHRLDKFAGIELRIAFVLPFSGKKHLDRFTRIRDRRMDSAKPSPLRRAVAGLLQQLALRGVEVRLAGL